MKKYCSWTFLLSILIFYTGCVDLKEVSTFSGTSEKTVRSIDDIGYSFYQQSAGFEMSKKIYLSIAPDQVAKNILTLPLIDEPVTVDALALKADAAINMIASSLASYFEALNKISDKSLVNYNYDDLAKELKNNKDIMNKLRLTDEKVDASSKIATVFTNAIVGHYRNRIIKEAIINNDAAVGKVIDALCMIIDSSLIPSITSDLGSLHARYTPLLSNPAIDFKTKFDWIKDYDLVTGQLMNSRQKAKKIIAGLQKIKSGHNDLSINIQTKKISSSEVKELFNKYSGQIYNLYQEFKIITN